MRLDLLEGVRTLPWSVSGITDTLNQPAEVGRCVVLGERAHARWLQAARTRGVRLPLAAAAAEIARARDRLQWSRA
jgi:hypothetical protein